MFEHLGHAELRVLGMTHLVPQRATALAQPGDEFAELPKRWMAASIHTPAADLHVLLDDALLVDMDSSPYQRVWRGKKYVLLDNKLGQGSVFAESEQHILFG
ncbi:hypothetical protein R69749_07190 [Paraburkholderia domus]|uniref:Uncharacterized protein n=1 Tax=Paraburkholderia domus TaxID=2793075 RepID=A0A9N8N9U4_9BURK|nr:hypothetical protein R70006_07257 [Paraburkholderia domus]CAE6883648.1 hypothetical protein R69749_07190 [Paraburkholderia domus]CAE6960507.1 hypothetical protein R70199_07284 [Paraburkholderia domus]CAE6969092.1 hypothetical protein R70211_07661 [Paraburkholderia domus]